MTTTTSNKIVRTPSFAGGGITPEEKKQMDAHAALWIQRIMRTDPIEPDKITDAIERLYAAAGLKKPKVIVVPSPLVMAVAGGLAAAILECQKEEYRQFQTYSATESATESATASATDIATRSATRSATDSATDIATDIATRSATRSATDIATYSATRSATDSATDIATDIATYSATRSATDIATDIATYSATGIATYSATGIATGIAWEQPGWAMQIAKDFAGDNQFLLEVMRRCIRNWHRPYQGGNMWGWWDCYLTAGRDILGLRLKEYDKYKAWEDAAINGGFRYMHSEFCMVSDFPEVLKKDTENRPHCDDGPSHRWRDGWELYHFHGVKVPKQVIVAPETLTVKQIDEETNQEIKRVMITRYGVDRYLQNSGATLLHEDEYGKLYQKTIPGTQDERGHELKLTMVAVKNSTPEPDGSIKDYLLEVHPEIRPMLLDGGLGEPQEPTAKNAVASTFGLRGDEFHPLIET